MAEPISMAEPSSSVSHSVKRRAKTKRKRPEKRVSPVPVPLPSRRSLPAVPDGWFDYSPYGTPIDDTRIIPIKTPLKQAFNNGRRKDGEVNYRGGVPLDDEFTPTQLVQKLKREGHVLGMVIDFTFTSRYYNPREFNDFGVRHVKVLCPGREIPRDDIYLQFVSVLVEFLRDTENKGSLVAVHCTHGLNRTGYLVCRYLIDHCSYSVSDAIQAFNSARGHAIERENYLEHLRKGCPRLPPSQRQTFGHPQATSQSSVEQSTGAKKHKSFHAPQQWQITGSYKDNTSREGRRREIASSSERHWDSWEEDSRARDGFHHAPDRMYWCPPGGSGGAHSYKYEQRAVWPSRQEPSVLNWDGSYCHEPMHSHSQRFHRGSRHIHQELHLPRHACSRQSPSSSRRTVDRHQDRPGGVYMWSGAHQ